jgi:nitroreductase
MTSSNNRTADHQIEPIFLDRWSPRGYDASEIPEADLHSFFEAARWAPSASNQQPWNFSYAKRDTDHWQGYLECLMDGNQRWAQNASVLIFVISRKFGLSSSGERRANVSHSFDTGAAWMALALQARELGYYAHGMGGIHKDKIAQLLGLNTDDYAIEAAVAIGKRAPLESLPEDLAAREVPSQRKPVSAFAFEGKFDPQV